MNKTLFGIAMCAATPFASAAGQADNVSESQAAQQIRRAGTQASAAGPADFSPGGCASIPCSPPLAKSMHLAPTLPSSRARVRLGIPIQQASDWL